MARAVGIDLGTTNSVVAVLEGGEPTVIANAEGVADHPVGRRLRQERRGPRRRGRQAPGRHQRRPHHPLGQAPHGHRLDDRDRRQGLHRRSRSARFVLQKLKRDAEAYLGETVTDAVITVPAYFNDAQRQATKEAGEIAGLNVLRIVNEPTAAALAYGLDKGENEQTILVFDLGGGTFDVSLLEIGDGVVEVKATSGDNHLGGDDWDQRVVDHLVKQFKNAPRRRPVQGQDGAAAAARGRREGQDRAVRARSETTINLPYITASRRGPAAPRREAHPRGVPAADRRPARPLQGARSSRSIKDAGITRRRDRPRRPRRRLDPDARRRRPGQGADRRQGAQQGRQPGRGRRRRRRAAGRCPQGRGQGRPAARRHPAVPRHRDQGRHHDQAHRAQHHDPDQALGDLHHGRRQPAVRADPGLPGRARDGGVQQEARHVRADRPAAGAARRAADRGHLRHRRQRHRARLRQGPRHRQGAVDDHHRRLRAAQGRHRADDARRRAVRRGGPASAARRPRPATRPSRSSTRPRSSSRRTATRSRPTRKAEVEDGARRAEGGARGRRHRRDQARRTEKVATASQKIGAAMYADAQAPAAPTRRRRRRRRAGDDATDDDVVDAEIVDEDERGRAA